MIKRILLFLVGISLPAVCHAAEPGSIKKASYGRVAITTSYGAEVTVAGAIKGSKAYLYDEDGKVFAEYEIRDGKFDGTAREYYKNGNLLSEEQYQNGMLNGTKKTYTDEGRLSSEKNYVNNRLEGILKTYYLDGRLASETNYANGRPAGTRKYNYKGETVSDSISEGQPTVESEMDKQGSQENNIDSFIPKQAVILDQQKQIKETRIKHVVDNRSRVDFYVMLDAPYCTAGSDFDGQHVLFNNYETMLIPRVDGNIGYGIGIGILFTVPERPVDFSIEMHYDRSQHSSSFQQFRYDVSYQSLEYVFKAYFNAKERTQPYLSLGFQLPTLGVEKAAFMYGHAGSGNAEFRGWGYNLQMGLSYGISKNLLIEGGLGYRNDTYTIAKGMMNQDLRIDGALNSSSIAPELHLMYVFR